MAVPDAGRYEFRGGDLSGVTEALDDRAAAAFIENLQPLVLDVRTPHEFAGGLLEDAQLVRVQGFRRQLPGLAAVAADGTLRPVHHNAHDHPGGES